MPVILRVQVMVHSTRTQQGVNNTGSKASRPQFLKILLCFQSTFFFLFLFFYNLSSQLFHTIHCHLCALPLYIMMCYFLTLLFCRNK